MGSLRGSSWRIDIKSSSVRSTLYSEYTFSGRIEPWNASGSRFRDGEQRSTSSRRSPSYWNGSLIINPCGRFLQFSRGIGEYCCPCWKIRWLSDLLPGRPFSRYLHGLHMPCPPDWCLNQAWDIWYSGGTWWNLDCLTGCFLSVLVVYADVAVFAL